MNFVANRLHHMSEQQPQQDIKKGAPLSSFDPQQVCMLDKSRCECMELVQPVRLHVWPLHGVGAAKAVSLQTAAGLGIASERPGSFVWLRVLKLCMCRLGPHAWPLPGVWAFLALVIGGLLIQLFVDAFVEPKLAALSDMPGFLETSSKPESATKGDNFFLLDLRAYDRQV